MARKPFKKKPNRRYSTRKPLWTPSAGITQSGLERYLVCPEQFALSYVEGVTSAKLKTAIEFGSLFHLCSEFVGKELPDLVAKRCCDAYKKTRLKTLPRDPKSRAELEELIGKVRIMFPLHCRYWEKYERKRRWIAHESQFSVPYTFTDHDGAPYTINLVGKIDKLFRNSKNRLGIHEKKTKSEVNSGEISDGLRADFQTLFYATAVSIKTGEVPLEIDYDVIRRPQQYIGKKDTLQTLLARIESDVNKRPTHYFARFLVTIAPDTIPNFRKYTLDPALRDLVRWWRSIEKNPFDRFGSPFHLLRLPALTNLKYGRSDLYDRIIRGQTAGYFVRSSVFPELNDTIPTTEAA